MNPVSVHTARPAVSPWLWCVVAVLLAWGLKLPQFIGVVTELRLPGNDDYFRLAHIRDWLAGAGWYETGQPRLGVDGVAIHWTRLIDLPVAVLIAVLEPLAGLGTAEKTAVIAWPALLFLLAVRVLIALARRIDPDLHPALVAIVAGLSGPAIMQFEPGRIDHHNAQLLLMALAALGATDPEARRGGALAGLACGLSLAIGLEALAPILVIGLFIALRWAWALEQARRLAIFASVFTFTATIGLAINLPPDEWGTALCDALSVAYLGPLAAGSIPIVIATSLLRTKSTASRLALLTVAGAASAVAMALIEPACFGGPYAGLSQAARNGWLPQVAEAQPLVESLRQTPMGLVPFLVVPLLSFGAAALVLAQTRDSVRSPAILLTAIVATSFLLSFLQVRQGQFLGLLSVPLIACALPVLRRHVRRFAERASQKAQIGTAALLAMLSAGALFAVTGNERPASADNAPASRHRVLAACDSAHAALHVAALPEATIFNTYKISGPLIVRTSHRVLVGPYHRSEGAVLDGMTLLRGNPQAVRALAERRGATHLALCLEPESAAFARSLGPDGLAARLSRGETFDWLTPLSGSGHLALYQIAD